VFATGPAGTGKTYLAVAVAVSAFLNKQVDRIILSRPAVEAGEKLGFLPGDLKEKIDPYLRPLYDALHDMIPAENLAKFMESGEIEIAPLAFMRGRTLNNAFVIVDEAQNTTPTQMKMLLTRLGESSRIVITGDPSQMDLPIGTKSGLADAVERLQHIIEIGFITFKDEDIIRHPLTAKILRAYNN
jgi:phosphate starvation-inducible PhoH-like protein